MDLAVFAAYFILVIGVALKAARQTVSTKRDYFLAGDKLPWWMVGGSIIASNISSHHFVGIMGVAYTRGFVALTIAWPAIFTGFAALLWIFLPFYLRNGFYLLDVYGYFTPGIAAMFLLGILWKRTTTAGAMAAGLATIPLTVFFQLLPPHLPESVGPYLQPFMNRTGIVFWLCMLIGATVSWATKPKPESELAGLVWNRESLRLPQELRERTRGLRNPAYWYLVILSLTIAMFVIFR